MKVVSTWRARLLWEVIQIGGIVASPNADISAEDEYGYVTGTVTFAWWYRPFVAFAFWLARPSECDSCK